MKTHSTNRKLKRMFVNILSIVVMLAMAFPVTTIAYAAPSSPFLGHWLAIDVDGSDIRLVIAGRPNGPYQITWTESFISFCNGEAGIVRGTGWLSESDPSRLEADLHLQCFTTGETLDFHLVWRYHPTTNRLSSNWNGIITLWRRPGQPVTPPPALNLRVNYGHDWVESFYEDGHVAWITVTESDGVTVKATAELFTEPKDYWGGETGFQTSLEDWNPAPPDIQPYDWVYGWVDNGASAQVQIGDISGMIDLVNDSIGGTINASWFSDPVQVECLDWGSGQEPPFDNQDSGFKLTNGEDFYSCSWEDWDIQPYQNVGVGYSGPDGHWVANSFYALNPRIVASEAGDWFWVTEFNIGTLDLFLYESAADNAALLWSGHQDVTDTWGITFVGNDIHGQDMVPGNYLVVSDGVNSKGLVLESITVDVFDTENEIMAGTAPLGREVWAAAGPQEWQERIMVTADLETGEWLADFKTIDFDITEDMQGWSSAAIYDGDGDANEGSTPPPPPNPRFVVFPEGEWFDGNDWPDGAIVDITVEGKPECATQKESWGYFFNGSFGEGCDVVVGDTVTFTDGTTTRTHVVRNLTITNVDKDANTITGTADDGALVYAWVHGFGETEMQLTAENGFWVADFDLRDFDLVEGTCGRSEIRDEFGNSTAVDWCVPNPRFSVFPEWDYIEAWDWPVGATVTAAIAGKPECSAEGVSGHPDWDPNAIFVPFWLPEDCDVVVGDVVTLTDGETIREHTVRGLTITAVDKDANTIAGTADPGAMVHVWPHGYNELLPITGEDGNWLADFNSIGIDLMEGMGGRTEIRDEFGNATAVEWRILNPYIEAAPYSDWIHAREWPIGAEMTLEIDDPSDGLGDVDYSETAFMQQAPWNPNDQNDIVADFRWPDQFAPGPGYVLTMSGNGQSKTLIISNLSMTSFDFDADTISGIGTPNVQIQVCANVPNRCITRWVTADEDGNWMADYGVPGTGNDDPDTFDVQPGSNGWAADYEADSDRTWFDWYVPNPHFTVFPEWEGIDSYEWQEGSVVHLAIDDPGTSEAPDFQDEKSVIPAPWDPNQFWVQFQFWGGVYDVKPGDEVTLTDGATTIIYTVEAISLSTVNATDDYIAGLAEPNEIVYVWPHDIGEQVLAEANSGGAWVADFAGVDFNLVPGMAGFAEVRDEFGNATAVEWYIPNTRFTVWPGQNYLEGYEWPDGALVSILAAGKAICSTEAVSGYPEWDPSNTFFSLNFPEGCTIGVGDLITLSDGATILTHEIQELAIVDIDLDANTLSGTAVFDPEQYMLHTWIHGVDGSYMQLSTEGGNWLADFDAQGLDLQPEMGGRVELVDHSSNATAVEWYVPNPRIVVQITDDWFRAENFTPNGQLTFWIYDAEGGALLRHPETTWQLDGSGSVTVGMWELGEIIDLVPGHYLVVSDGTLTKELALEELTFDVFDLTQGLLQGTAPGEDGRLVWVGIGFENDGWFMDVFTDVDGNWAADFGAPVPSDYQWVAAQIFDADGDASELRPASQIVFLRPSCGDTYTVQAGSVLEIRYGSWVAIGGALAIQNAEHLTVELVLNGETVTGTQQPVVAASEIPCGSPPDDAYGVFYVAQVAPPSPGTYVVQVTWSFDEAVTDGYDANGDGEPDWYGPGEVFTREFTIIVP